MSVTRVGSFGHPTCRSILPALINKSKSFSTVDDGTATMSCCQWRLDSGEGCEKFELGQLVVVQGKIATFRGERQLNVDSISIHYN